MATSSVTSYGTDWYTRPYEGGWRSTSTGADKNGWLNNFAIGAHDGYCYSTSDKSKGFCFCFRFTNLSDYFHAATSLKIKIPLVRSGTNPPKKGTLYIKMFTGEGSGAMESIAFGAEFKPSNDFKDAWQTWERYDSSVFSCEFTIDATTLANHTITKNSYIYVTVGGTNIIQIGSPGCTPDNGWWSATLNYEETYDFVTANQPTITDNGNNTFSIVGSAGNAATNNAVKSTTLWYKIGNEEFTQADSLTYAGSINCEASAASQKITAYTAVQGERSHTSSTRNEVSVLNFVRPGAPGTPSLPANGRLTAKQNWVWTWTAADPGNTASHNAVRGYWARLWRLPKGSNEWEIVTTDEWESTTTSFTVDPASLGFAAGDTAQLEIAAYSKNKVKKGNTQLWSPITGTYNHNGQTINLYTLSAHYLVENAGIVKVKVNNKWVEGQVWVKANGEWHEAETVNVKVDGNWVESQ